MAPSSDDDDAPLPVPDDRGGIRYTIKGRRIRVQYDRGKFTGKDSIRKRSKSVRTKKLVEATRTAVTPPSVPSDDPQGVYDDKEETKTAPVEQGGKRSKAKVDGGKGGTGPKPPEAPRFGAIEADPNLTIEAPRTKESSGGTATKGGRFGGFTELKPLPHPKRSPPPAATPPGQTTFTPPGVQVSPPLGSTPIEGSTLHVPPPDSFGESVLRKIGGFPDTIARGASNLGRAFTKASARFIIPFADEAMEVWETIGGSAGASYLAMRSSMATRAALSFAARALTSPAGLVAAAALVGVGIGLLIDHYTDVSTTIAVFFSNLFTKIPEQNARNGGVTTVRGQVRP